MAQSNVIPLFGSFTFEVHFEELPLFRDGAWRAGSIDGVAEVVYDFRDRDWYVSNLTLHAHNGQIGAAAEGKTLTLNSEDHANLYELILDALDEHYSSHIDERVEDELADRGYARAA